VVERTQNATLELFSTLRQSHKGPALGSRRWLKVNRWEQPDMAYFGINKRNYLSKIPSRYPPLRDNPFAEIILRKNPKIHLRLGE